MSITFAMTAGTAIQRAYLMLGSLEPPYTPSDFQEAQGLTVLNGLLKALETDQINVFRQTQVALPVAAMSPTVPIVPYIMALSDARWVVTPAPNLYERAMGIYSYEDYQLLPNKLSPVQTPSVVALDRQVSTSQLYVWPVAQNGGTINATVGRTANDVNALTDAIDLPSEWHLGLTYMLADALMDDQGVAAADPATAQRIHGLAEDWHTKLKDFDRPASLWIRPWGKRGRSKIWRG